MSWPTTSGAAYISADKARAAERFRHHVWSPNRPNRRIMRPWWCPKCRRQDCQPEAHHVDYSRPFLVAWLCTSCHRRVEAGTLRLGKKDLYDYSSLVPQVRTRWRKGERGRRHGGLRKAERRGKAVPF